MCTGQNGEHLGLKNCGVSSERKAELPSNGLPIYPGPVPPPHLGPISKPDMPLDSEGSPSASGLILPGQPHNPTFGFKIIGWLHHVQSHMKYGVRLLKPHQYSTMTTIGIKVRPTSQTPEVVCRGPSLTLHHQIQWWETNKCLHRMGGCCAHHSHYP
jgi:hypothetical protein